MIVTVSKQITNLGGGGEGLQSSKANTPPSTKF